MLALIVSTHVPLFPATGASARDHYLVKHLVQEHQISFVAPVYSQQQVEQVAALPKWIDFHPVYVPETSQVLQNPSSLSDGFVMPRLRRLQHIVADPPYEIMTLEPTLAALEAFLRRVDWKTVDVVQIEHSPIGTLRQAIPNHVPAILDCHNVHSSIREREYRAITRWRRRIAEWTEWQKTRTYERNTIRRFDWLLACSEVDKARLQNLDPAVNCLVVPNGVDTDYFQRHERDEFEAQDILFVGDMGYEPNSEAVAFFCEAVFPRLLREYPAARFLIVGHRPSPGLRQLAEHSTGNIVVTGSVADVRPYMASAAVGVVPLLNGGGTRLKILEMLSMEMAVVTTSVGCEGIDVIDGQHLMIADTADAFTRAVKTLLHNQELRHRLGEQGRRLVQLEYEWSTIVPAVNHLWRSLAAQKDKAHAAG